MNVNYTVTVITQLVLIDVLVMTDLEETEFIVKVNIYTKKKKYNNNIQILSQKFILIINRI